MRFKNSKTKPLDQWVEPFWIEIVVRSKNIQAYFPSKTLFTQHRLQDSYASGT